MPLYKNREDAGKQLAQKLMKYKDQSGVLVLGLPRGGVPVAAQVAKALHAPLDIFLVRKLGVPGREELAMGAIASHGVRVINPDVVRSLGIPKSAIDRQAAMESAELKRRAATYRGSRQEPDIRARTVILVDDGLATGASMYAAIAALKELAPENLVVAVPVGPSEICRALAEYVDEVVCAATPDPFYGVGEWYEDFSQTSDEEVRQIIREAEKDTS